MKIIVVNTPDGRVVRRIWPTGEDAWRWSGHGIVACSADHKGPWVAVNAINVPREVLRAFAGDQA